MCSGLVKNKQELFSDIFTVLAGALCSPYGRVRAGNFEADLLDGLSHSVIIGVNRRMHNQIDLHIHEEEINTGGQ